MRTLSARVWLWVTIAIPAGVPLGAQMPAGVPDRPDTASMFAPLTLAPAPSAIRLASGAPGPKYWQNRTDYDLKVTLDTATHTVQGSMVLRYTNNSPDTLKELWFQTERRSMVIDRFDQVVRGKPVAVTYAHPADDVLELHVTPVASLLPGRTTTFQVQWHVTTSGVGSRTGRDGALYEMAQWYPRPNVYDDVKGWNTESYATGKEFYLEYGDYTMELTVPAGYVVAATGTLTNPQAVLTTTQRARLAQAAKADTVVPIVTTAELASGAARPTTAGMLTWKFKAKNVRDAVWAASPEYQWDATSWHGTLAQAYYRPVAAGMWGHGEMADQARAAIQEYSERWYPYPYPQVSVVEGPVVGMEYPMLSFDVDVTALERSAGGPMGFDGQEARKNPVARQFAIITHEVGHDWFPMIVGSNERVHEWMDEGFNTFINSFSEARRYKDVPQELTHRVYNGKRNVVDEDSYGGTAYVLQVLRRDILGPAVFDSAFRTYIRRWAYKHPTPADFFRTIENVSGRKLDWFWRGMFQEAPRFDQAVDSVTQAAQGRETRVTVTYGNRGRMVLPLLVRFTFADGTTKDVTHPVDVWRANPAAYTATYTFPQAVTGVTLDPDTHLPDADTANNTWKAP